MTNIHIKTAILSTLLFATTYYTTVLGAFNDTNIINNYSDNQKSACGIIENNFYQTVPWTSYSLIFEPVKRGKLVVWEGISTLPTSDLKCQSRLRRTLFEEVSINFGTFAHRLEWTFFDATRTETSQGITVAYYENSTFLIGVSLDNNESYLKCNTINKIELLDNHHNKMPYMLVSTCPDCSTSTIKVIEHQIGQLVSSQIIDQLKDNLHWHLSQSISKQHSSSNLS